MYIVSAAEYETAPLLAHLHGQDKTYFACGIGVFSAHAFALKHQELFVDQDILYVGSAGISKGFRGIELRRASSIHWLPTCQRQKMSYTIAKTPPMRINPLPVFHPILKCETICSPNVSLVPAEGTYMENIEAYAFFLPLLDKVRSINVILAITNEIGHHAHQQWRENYLQAAEILGERVAELL